MSSILVLLFKDAYIYCCLVSVCSVKENHKNTSLGGKLDLQKKYQCCCLLLWGTRISLMPSSESWITAVGRLSHKKGEQNDITLNHILSLPKWKRYHWFIEFCHARKKKWNIDWQFHGRLIQQLPTESWCWLFPGEQTGWLMFIYSSTYSCWF